MGLRGSILFKYVKLTIESLSSLSWFEIQVLALTLEKKNRRNAHSQFKRRCYDFLQFPGAFERDAIILHLMYNLPLSGGEFDHYWNITIKNDNVSTSGACERLEE